MDLTASMGARPTRAAATASAASTSSIACSHERSEVAAQTATLPYTASNSPGSGDGGGSEVEEDSLVSSLQSHVEVVAVCDELRDERPTAGFRDAVEHRVVVVRANLVGEVEPGHDAVQQPPREHGDVDVRRLRLAVCRG